MCVHIHIYIVHIPARITSYCFLWCAYRGIVKVVPRQESSIEVEQEGREVPAAPAPQNLNAGGSLSRLLSRYPFLAYRNIAIQHTAGFSCYGSLNEIPDQEETGLWTTYRSFWLCGLEPLRLRFINWKIACNFDVKCRTEPKRIADES